MEAIIWMDNELAHAESMVMEGRVEEALNVMNNLLFDEPGYAPLHNYLGWTYMYHANNLALADLHFRTALRFAPDFAPPYIHMGDLLIRGGRYAEAIEFVRAGLTKPEAIRTVLMETMAQAYEMLGDYRKAIRAYKEAAMASVVDFEVNRMLTSAKRCRKKRLAMMFSLW